MTDNVKLLSMKAPSTALTARTLAEHLGDTLNVKSYGALGDGIADDTAEIQACFDAAFITSGTAHGIANPHLNRAVFFPPGKYMTSAPLTLTDVYGARIYGSGRWTTAIFNTNTSNPSVIVTNGFSHCLLSDMELIAPNSSGSVALDLDWDGTTGSAGLSHNMFENVECGSNAAGYRIANQGNEGHANQFLHCSAGATTGVGAGWLIVGADAHSNHILGGNTNNVMDYAVKCTGGSVHVQTLSCQTTNICDLYVSSGNPCSFMGTRSESPNFFIGIGPGATPASAFISCVSHAGRSGGSGPWINSQAYAVNNSVISQADNYNVYKCTVAHTSAASGTFAADRAGAASGKWALQPVGVLADLTNFKLVMDATSSGDYSGSQGGGVVVGDSASTFYSRGGVFLRNTAPYGTDFFTGFTGTHSAGSGTPWYVI